jgi:hypothetical protein
MGFNSGLKGLSRKEMKCGPFMDAGPFHDRSEVFSEKDNHFPPMKLMFNVVNKI